jgi:hypothetical protein
VAGTKRSRAPAASREIQKEPEASRQERLHREAAKTFGTIHGRNSNRSEQVSQIVRKKLKDQREQQSRGS